MYADVARPRRWWHRLWPWTSRRRVLVRAVTIREPLYTHEDRAELLALAEYRAGMCPACGGPLVECTSHEASGITFEASRLRCRRKDAVLIAQDGLENTQRADALVWSTTTIRR